MRVYALCLRTFSPLADPHYVALPHYAQGFGNAGWIARANDTAVDGNRIETWNLADPVSESKLGH